MVVKKGTTTGQKSKGSKTAAKAYKKTAAGKKKGGGKHGISKLLVPTQDPIIITGGSLFLQYANKTADGFADNGSGNGKRKLKHKKNSVGPVVLTVIEFQNSQGQTLLPSIDLRALGINHNCQIIVNYDL
jgi:hypothetical protein